MKKCSYCGREYDDSASTCQADGKPLDRFITAPTTATSRARSKVGRSQGLPLEVRHNRVYLFRWLTGGVFFVLLGLLIWAAPIWTRVLSGLFVALGAVLCWYAGRRLWDKRVKLLLTPNGLTYYAGKSSRFVAWHDVNHLTFKATTRTGLRYTSAKIIIQADKNNKEIVLNIMGLDPGPDELFEILKSATDLAN